MMKFLIRSSQIFNLELVVFGENKKECHKTPNMLIPIPAWIGKIVSFAKLKFISMH
jgi:hypothetical protein